MSKYIDTDKLIAEIEERIKNQEKWIAKNLHGAELAEAVRTELKQLLDFIKSRQQEQPSENLEEAAENEFPCEKWMTDEMLDLNDRMQFAFRKGAQWQKWQNERLIKLTHDSWYKEGFIYGKIEGLSEDEKYQQGRFDMKEQMLKDAVEGFVFQSADYYPKELIATYNGDLKTGDKVKIIIVKEDEE